MKQKLIPFLLSSLCCLASCNGEPTSEASLTSEEPTSSLSSLPTSSAPTSSSSSSKSSKATSTASKVTIAAHTLKDNNPPIVIDGDGEQVDEDTWNAFKYGASSKFNNHYNYTYTSYSGGNQTIEAFTKNGYFTQSMFIKTYYERKSGNSFYVYKDAKEGYLRSETTLDLQSKYTYRLEHEIYVHMFDYSNYEYYDIDGTYRYFIADGCSSAVKFQNGYLTYLFYIVGLNMFQIDLAFDTKINIPESYYYQ